MKFSFDISDFLGDMFSLTLSVAASVSLHCSLQKVFLSLLAGLWSSAFSWVNLSLSPLLFVSLLSSAICKASCSSSVLAVYTC